MNSTYPKNTTIINESEWPEELKNIRFYDEVRADSRSGAFKRIPSKALISFLKKVLGNEQKMVEVKCLYCQRIVEVPEIEGLSYVRAPVVHLACQNK